VKTSEKYAEAQAEENRRLIRHREGCPAERVERFKDVRPAQYDASGELVTPGKTATIVRCIECGRQSISFDGGGRWSYE
jgi:hypothetical protein